VFVVEFCVIKDFSVMYKCCLTSYSLTQFYTVIYFVNSISLTFEPSFYRGKNVSNFFA